MSAMQNPFPCVLLNKIPVGNSSYKSNSYYRFKFLSVACVICSLFLLLLLLVFLVSCTRRNTRIQYRITKGAYAHQFNSKYSLSIDCPKGRIRFHWIIMRVVLVIFELSLFLKKNCTVDATFYSVYDPIRVTVNPIRERNDSKWVTFSIQCHIRYLSLLATSSSSNRSHTNIIYWMKPLIWMHKFDRFFQPPQFYTLHLDIEIHHQIKSITILYCT